MVTCYNSCHDVISLIHRRFVWNFFRLEAEHLNNVGEFRAVRDISLQPIKLAPKDETEDEDIVCPLQSIPPGGAGALQLVRISSDNNSHTASIRSLNVHHSSPNTHTPAITSCNVNVVIENQPTETLTAVTNRLESTATGQHAARTEVKNSTAIVTEAAAGESELITPNKHTTVEEDSQVMEMVSDSTV